MWGQKETFLPDIFIQKVGKYPHVSSPTSSGSVTAALLFASHPEWERQLNGKNVNGKWQALEIPLRPGCVYAFRFVLDKRRGKIYLCRRGEKLNRGIWHHKSVSDRLKGWNRERSDTLVAFPEADMTLQSWTPPPSTWQTVFFKKVHTEANEPSRENLQLGFSPFHVFIAFLYLADT